ncbi:MAG: antitoxin [Acidimicrobiales bacterium]
MRTTLDLDADVLGAARALSRVDGRSLGRVVSDLARRGLAPSGTTTEVDGRIPVFRVGPDAPVITDQMVQAGLEDP